MSHLSKSNGAADFFLKIRRLALLFMPPAGRGAAPAPAAFAKRMRTAPRARGGNLLARAR
jgi:hypothetical protein